MKSQSTEHLHSRDFLLLGSAAILCAVIYVSSAYSTYGIGFPLDDSWIHQTYARNVAENGEWAFKPGVRSAGSTSPLWTIFLTPGYLLKISPLLWANMLGCVILFNLAWLCEWSARKWAENYRPELPWVGLSIVFAWQLSWASFSGMETILHAAIITLVLILILTKSRNSSLLGLLTGISVWIRPDGITLIAPVTLYFFLLEKSSSSRLRSLGLFMIGFGSLFGSYLLFNLFLDGSPWPNTFYAKQAEYVIWQKMPIFEQAWPVVLQFLVGTGVILLPGAIGWTYVSIRRRDWSRLVIPLWLIGYVALYMFRLPPYQHGRYLMPGMPIFFLLGMLGLMEFNNSKLFGRRHWMVETGWIASLAVVELLFIYLGARAYAQDVAVIESEMVKTATWANANLPSGALIAAHDIGALGYFDDHELIDLAGLISPEVIPFIRDENQLASYLNERHADYLIAFPDFYPIMTKNLERVFTTQSKYAPVFGEENMTIFLWDTSK